MAGAGRTGRSGAAAGGAGKCSPWGGAGRTRDGGGAYGEAGFRGGVALCGGGARLRGGAKLTRGAATGWAVYGAVLWGCRRHRVHRGHLCVVTRVRIYGYIMCIHTWRHVSQ